MTKNTEETEGDIYGFNNDPFQYETTVRDKNRERLNIAFASSWRGRCSAFIDRHLLQLRQNIHGFGLVLKRFVGVIKTFLAKSIDFFRVFLYNEYCNKKLRKDKQMSTKKDTKTTTNTNENTKSKRVAIDWGRAGRGIIGLGLLISVASMIFAGIVIFMGTGQDLVPKVLIIPMMLHAAVILVKQFTKGDK